MQATGFVLIVDVMLATYLKHLHNVETRFYCPQTFLSLDFLV